MNFDLSIVKFRHDNLYHTENLARPNRKFITHKFHFYFVPVPKKVRIGGLEPTRLAAPDPKSGTSTNFAISASKTQRHPAIGILLHRGCKGTYFFLFFNLKKNIYLSLN